MVETASRITEERVDVDDLMKALCNTWNAGIFLTLDPGQKCPNQKMKKLKTDSIKLKACWIYLCPAEWG
jgi:SAM-dependent MidA family methyltransferase